eukprot:TRINITY_DN71_c0_g1_i1.p1 TRINITY_DN71_c0_g1~~TRINITY_DN71_c0_g1_i1.p1  ORF type:complete len:138 (+),score=39.37 TRINITY_DN71_c0_g1_i1:82-495(+)
MKFNTNVTSSRRKQRKARFQSNNLQRRKLMSSALSTTLRKEHQKRAIPVRKDDEVKIIRGIHRGKEGKVTNVYRKKWCIYVEKITREKMDGKTVNIPIDPSNVIITKLKEDKSRKVILARGKKQTEKGEKFTVNEVN